MDRRSDALVAAAKMISKFPELAIGEGEGTVITTGRLNVFPNGANVIPDKVVFTVDIRSRKEEHVLSLVGKVKDLVDSYKDNGIKTSVEQQLFVQPKAMNTEIISLFKENCSQLDLPYYSINSGAGHDAMVFSDYTDVGMLFIPSKAGLSHCPEEWSDSNDIANAVQILYEAAKKLTGTE
jgi:allantoate deiminase